MAANKSKGITLIEILVSVAVIAVLSAILLVRYNVGAGQYLVENAAQQIASAIRKTEALAGASQEFLGEIPYGYGLFFEPQKNPIIFADLTAKDRVYNGGNEKFEAVSLPEQVIIQSVSGGNNLTVFFEPPKLNAYIDGVGQGAIAEITIADRRDPGITRTIQITNNGKVSISN